MTEATKSMISTLSEKAEAEDVRNIRENGSLINNRDTGDSSRNDKNQGEMFYPYSGKQNVTLSSSMHQTSNGGTSGSDGSGAENSSSTSSTSSPNSVLINMKQTNNNGPVCKNCLTITTPLWRRDENGAVLCNACGLFLKLHGRPRPISLKTDVIKSRNRKGTHNHHTNESNLHQTNGSGSPRIVDGHKRSQSDDKKRKKVGVVEKNGNTVYGTNSSNINSNDENSNSSGNSNKNSDGSGLRIKRAKVNDTPQLSSSESKDIRSAATTLEILMSSDSSKPKLKPKINDAIVNTKNENSPSAAISPSLSHTQPATQLPHLSSLLGDVNSSRANSSTNIVSGQLVNVSTDNVPNSKPSSTSERFGSPNMVVPNSMQLAKQHSHHVTSINDVLNENVNNSNQRKISSAASPNGFTSVPLTTHSSTSSLVPDVSVSQRYASPPPSVTSHISTLPLPMQTSLQKQHNNDSYSKNDIPEIPLNVTLRNEEEVIKLKTRINELELVTDLYKRHIFELDEKCKNLQLEMRTLKH